MSGIFILELTSDQERPGKLGAPKNRQMFLSVRTQQTIITPGNSYCRPASPIVRVDWLTTTSKASAHASTVRS